MPTLPDTEPGPYSLHRRHRLADRPSPFRLLSPVVDADDAATRMLREDQVDLDGLRGERRKATLLEVPAQVEAHLPTRQPFQSEDAQAIRGRLVERPHAAGIHLHADEQRARLIEHPPGQDALL